MGLAAAKAIASASEVFHVIMAGRSLSKVKSAMSEIETAGIKGSLSTVPLDVTDENSIEQAANSVQETYGRLDVLVNNAAVGSMDPDIKTRMQLCMATNVIGPAVAAAAFRPLLITPGPQATLDLREQRCRVADPGRRASVIDVPPAFRTKKHTTPARPP